LNAIPLGRNMPEPEPIFTGDGGMVFVDEGGGEIFVKGESI
jgi:hypothetical protein